MLACALVSDYYPESESPLRAELVQQYERFAERREAVLLNYGFHTAVAYWGDLDSLMRWCMEADIDVLNPRTEDISRYLDELRGMDYSPNTIARRLTAFRLFYDHLVGLGELDASPVADLRERRRRPSRAIERAPKSRTGRTELLAAARISSARDHALVALHLNGLSHTQLARLTRADLGLEAKRPFIRVTDRGVPKDLRLSAEAIAALTRYLAAPNSTLPFTDGRGAAMDRFVVQRAIKKVRLRSGAL